MISVLIFAAIGLVLVGRLSAIRPWTAAMTSPHAEDAQRPIRESKPPPAKPRAPAAERAAPTEPALPAAAAQLAPPEPAAQPAPTQTAARPAPSEPGPPEPAAQPAPPEPAPIEAAAQPTTAEPAPPAAVAATPIRVAINSDPWSNVEVDGVAAGTTPLTIELAPGPHRLRADMADGRILEKQIQVTADDNRVVLR
jgi:hypothetical protein